MKNLFVVSAVSATLLSFLIASHSTMAGPPLAERLLNVDDPGYNDALSEMQDLDITAKTKLAVEMTKMAKTRKNDEERSNAVLALGDISQQVPSVVATLLTALNDKYAPCRQAAISSIERTGQRTPQIVSALIKKIGDKDGVVRMKAISALGAFGPAAQAAAPSLKKFLKDKDLGDLARQALDSIGRPEAQQH